MFDWMPEVCRELRLEFISLYWLLLTPITLLVIIFEFYKKNLDFKDIIRRVILSLLLLWSFEEITSLIAMLGDGITEKIGGINDLAKVLDEIYKGYEQEGPSFLEFRQMLIYVINLCCYLIALLSFYLTDVLINFVYAVLYVISPLAFLCMIPNETQNVPKNLYKGIINTVVWKILWSVLGVMLLEFTRSPAGDWENFFMSAMVNLCIGVSMLLIPFFARSLISDGLSSAATGLAAATTVPIGKAMAGFPLKKGRQLKDWANQERKNNFSDSRKFAGRKLRQIGGVAKEITGGFPKTRQTIDSKKKSIHKGAQAIDRNWRKFRSMGEMSHPANQHYSKKAPNRATHSRPMNRPSNHK